MAYDVTSQWDDIHRELGNYEKLPEKVTEAECTNENIDRLEDLTVTQKQDKMEELVQKQIVSGNFF